MKKILIVLLLGMTVNLFAFNTKNISGWNSYLCNVNNNITSVLLDFDLKEKAPLKDYPKLTWYWIKMKNPKDNGLGSNDDLDELIAHEEKLDKFLSTYPIIFAGSITTEGRREFYFYTKSDIDFKTIIKKFVGEKAIFPFQIGEKMDSNWTQYLNLLYPNKKEIKTIQNRAY